MSEALVVNEDWVGKRLLAKIGRGCGTSIEEFRIVELSPSGTWIKLMNTNGNKFWRALAEFAFVEELRDLKADKPK